MNESTNIGWRKIQNGSGGMGGGGGANTANKCQRNGVGEIIVLSYEL